MPNSSSKSKACCHIDSSPNPPDPSLLHEDNPSTITDPTRVSQPIKTLVDPVMSRAWTINTSNAMYYIFDTVNPAMQFKQGMAYDNQADDFPEYGLESSGDLTETDTVAPGLMQFKLRPYE